MKDGKISYEPITHKGKTYLPVREKVPNTCVGCALRPDRGPARVGGNGGCPKVSCTGRVFLDDTPENREINRAEAVLQRMTT